LWGDAGITLGLSRLAIVAPQTPARISSNAAAGIHAVMNGEIYNHESLRGELLRRGVVIESGGADTVVLPHLYEAHGAGFAQHLDGMFAIAIWDARARRLTLARDRAGEKPLFLSVTPRAIAFASEPWRARRGCRGSRAIPTPPRSRATSCTDSSRAPTARSPRCVRSLRRMCSRWRAASST